MVLFSCSTGQTAPYGNPWTTNRALNTQLQDLLRHSLAKSTHRNYLTGAKQFIQFCHRHRVQPLPAKKLTLVYFTVALSRRLSPASIQVYTSAVESLHRQHGMRDPTHHNHLLKLVLRGARRSNAINSSRARQPITLPILLKLLRTIKRSSLNKWDKYMLTAAFTLAFYGMLRISEFSIPSIFRFDHVYTQATLTYTGTNTALHTTLSTRRRINSTLAKRYNYTRWTTPLAHIPPWSVTSLRHCYNAQSR